MWGSYPWRNGHRARELVRIEFILHERKAEVIKRVQGPSSSVVVPRLEGAKPMEARSWGLEVPSSRPAKFSRQKDLTTTK